MAGTTLPTDLVRDFAGRLDHIQKFGALQRGLEIAQQLRRGSPQVPPFSTGRGNPSASIRPDRLRPRPIKGVRQHGAKSQSS